MEEKLEVESLFERYEAELLVEIMRGDNFEIPSSDGESDGDPAASKSNPNKNDSRRLFQERNVEFF